MQAFKHLSLALAATLPFIAAAAHAAPDVVQAPIAVQAEPLPPTRAEVQADTAIWFAAGMDKYSGNGASELIDSPQYRKDLAVYTALRASPQYTALVRDYAHGDDVQLHLARDPLRLTIATR